MFTIYCSIYFVSQTSWSQRIFIQIHWSGFGTASRVTKLVQQFRKFALKYNLCIEARDTSTYFILLKPLRSQCRDRWIIDLQPNPHCVLDFMTSSRDSFRLIGHYDSVRCSTYMMFAQSNVSNILFCFIFFIHLIHRTCAYLMMILW